MLRYFTAIACMVMLVSCSNDHVDTIFNAEALPSQFFTVNTASDTVLRTKRGAVINIPKGALQASSTSVQLEIKEAYTISDMVRAGLTTQSNGQLLSSGGMIYINAAAGQQVKIAQAIKASIPTNFIDEKMQLFTGEVDGNGNLNWTTPRPLDSLPRAALARGRAMFRQNCASCHSISKPLTGPALAHISKKRDRKWLYQFTRNNQELLRAGDRRALCVYYTWNRTPMNLFPDLTDRDLQILYDYIEHVSDSARLPLPKGNSRDCLDSCRVYMDLLSELSKKSDVIQYQDYSGQVVENRRFDTSSIFVNDTTRPTTVLTPIAPFQNEFLNYQFTFDSFGWYNVDHLMKDGPGMQDCNLKVTLDGKFTERMSVYIVLPSIRVFSPAGKVEGRQNEYVFVEESGRLFLPANASGYILAIGDNENDILFAQAAFQVTSSKKLTLTPTVVTKAAFDKAIAQLDFDQLTISVSDTISKVVQPKINDMSSIEKLRPKNCDCCY